MSIVPIRNLGVGGSNPNVKYITKGNSIKTESSNLNIGEDNIYYVYPNQGILFNIDFTDYNSLKIVNYNTSGSGRIGVWVDDSLIGQGHTGTSISTDSFDVSSYSGTHLIRFSNNANSTIYIYSVVLEK